MKIARLAPAALLLAAACGAPPPPDPLQETLAAIADPQAAGVVRSLFAAYGGHDAWLRHRSVGYEQRLEVYAGETVPQAVSRQRHRFTLGEEVRGAFVDLEGILPQVVQVSGERLRVTRGGEPVTDPEALGFPRALSRVARRTFMQPWNLVESGASLAARSEREPPPAGKVPSGPCDVVRLTIGPAQEGKPRDWHDFYVSRLSRLVERVHSYRAEDGSYRVTVWSDHRRFDALRVATRRTTYMSDAAGAVGPLEAVLEYSDIRFDVPVDDLPPPAAAPAAAAPAPSPEQDLADSPG